MQFEKEGTLARIVGNPLRRKRKISVSASHFATVVLAVDKNNPAAVEVPDSAAARFYALNQLISTLFQKFTPNERMPEWAQSIACDYEVELVRQHRHMVWYTFLVICREFRHLKNPATVFKSAKFSQGVKDLLPMIKDSQDNYALNQWLKAVPKEDLAGFCRCLAQAFGTGSWGGGYGGKPWGLIAKTLADYFAGEISAEVFIDTAYTLAHNNGPMFNKGMLYSMYTSKFLTLLDVQRAGMVCEGLASGQVQGWFTVKDADVLVKHIQNINQAFDGTVGEYINWYQVEALGAVGTYAAYKAEQDKKYGKTHQKTLINGVPVQFTDKHFTVYPGQTVQIYKRLKAA